MVHLLARTVRFTDPDVGLRTATTKYEYGDAQNPGRVTRTIPPRGNTAGSPDYTYATSYTCASSGSEAGLLKEIVDPLGSKVTYGYDPVGRLTTVVDPLGNAAGGVPAEHTTSFSYDGEDRLRFETQPAPVPGGSPLVTETRYDQVGNRTVRIDARGQVTTYAYDDRNSLFQVKQSPSPWTSPLSPPGDAITTEYAYDAGGSAIRVTRAKGNGTYERVTDYEFDGRGLQRRETQYPSWPSTSGALVATRAYDPAGNLATLTDPLGQATTFGYDALNRVTSVDYADPGTGDVTYGYDPDGNRTSMADGTGSTSYTYDEVGRLQSVTSPGPTSVGYRYDLDGNRSKLIYPDSTAVTYTFDKAARLSSLADWASRSVSYTYWPDGLVKTATNPDASVATYNYDNVRRQVDIVHMRAGTKIEGANYGFDVVGNVTSMANGSLANQFARPDGLVSSSGTWTGTFASINEPTPNDSTFLASPASPTTAHFYEVTLGDVTPPFVTSGTTFRYRYAKSGNNSGKTTNLVVELRQGSTVIAAQTHNNIPGVDGSGWQPGTLTLNAAQAAMVTDVADLRLRFRPSSSGGGQGRQALVSWAEVQLPGSGDPSTLASYGYDRLSRLVSIAGPDGPRSYTYDPVGNRLTKVAGTTTAYTYDRADRILTAGGTTVSVDANGNLTANGADAFDFDQANRLVGATVGGSNEAYVYDGDGTRFSRQTGSDPAIRYVSDIAGGLPITIADGDRKYVYGAGLAYAVSGSDVEIFHNDGLGSIRAITDASGTVTSTQRTDEWGIQVASTGTSSQPFGFTGEPRDGTGLTYLRARYYDPELGRFLSRDTWPGIPSSPITLNRYAYAYDNPTTQTDPSGHFVDAIVDILSLAYDAWSLATGPEKDQAINLAALGADAASLAIPGFTGGGWLVRGTSHADEVADGLRWVDEAATAACSFTADTLVATPDGPVEISNIEVGDIVLAWDEMTGKVVERPVTAVLPHPDDEIAKVTIDGVVLTTTPDHPFYTLDRGWIEAGDLWAGAHVKTPNGVQIVTGIQSEPFNGILWDLTIADAHTYFVGRGELLVHNCVIPPRIPANPADAPGPDWVWKGSGPPGSPQGQWTRPGTPEYLHWDPNEKSYGPHWDWRDVHGNEWRIFPDGSMKLK
jgi:RHS repeat-associated protein